MDRYPGWVCYDCGIKASNGFQISLSTWHENTCDICNEVKAVTQPRDFGHPKFNLKK